MVTVAKGFVPVTLAITYLVPVGVGGHVKRQIAVYLTALGDRPEDIVIGAFDGATLQRLGQDLSGIAQQLFLHQQRHLTYPVLHYFHSVEPATSAPLRLVVLDEALTLIEAGIPDHVERPGRQLSTMRAALDAYLDIVGSAYITAAPDPPPPPGLASLREADIPTVDDAIYVKSIDDLRDRRRVLAGIVAHDGWAWSAVTKDSASE